jgi:predicted nucleic acid-binding protein
MTIIVDASAVIAAIAGEPEKAAIVRLTRGAELAAPASIHWEIGNAFSVMLKRHRIRLEEAERALAIYRQIPINFLEVDLEEALRLAASMGIYAYDAYIIYCGLHYRLPLLSLDKQLAAAARRSGVRVLEVP